MPRQDFFLFQRGICSSSIAWGDWSLAFCIWAKAVTSEANHDYQFNSICNYVGDKTLGLSVKAFPNWAIRGGKTYPKCGQHHSRSWSPGPNKNRKESWGTAFTSLLSDCRYNTTCCLTFLLPWLHIIMDCTLDVHQNKPFLPKLFSS